MFRVGVLYRQILAPAVPTTGCERAGGRGRSLQAASCAAADVAKEMAPTGSLRVAIDMRNQWLVTGKTDSGDPDGLAPAMASAFAARLGVPVQFVPYDSPADLAKEAEQDKWDVAMIGADPGRADFVDFTAPYCQIDCTYAVPTTSGFWNCAAVDKQGVRIAGCAGAAYVLWLERNLKNATVVTADGHDPTYELFNEDKLQAVAGIRSKLKKDGAKRPGTRLLSDKFMAVEQAACTKKGRVQGFKMLSDFVDEAKTSGLVKELMVKYGVQKDLTIP